MVLTAQNIKKDDTNVCFSNSWGLGVGEHQGVSVWGGVGWGGGGGSGSIQHPTARRAGRKASYEMLREPFS